jgi:hypothetical protein
MPRRSESGGRDESDADLAKHGDTSGNASEVALKFATDLVVYLASAA